MKITDVQTIRLRAAIPADGQVFSRSGVRSTRSTTLVRVDTDEGISGIGSASGNGELIEVIVAKVIKPLLVGMDPTEIDAIWDKGYVRGGHKEFGTRGIGVVALSGVDIALWDILGKARGVPLYQLLGGKCRDKVPVYATALYPEEPSKVARRARGFADQGFHGVKIKVGFDLDQDIRIVRAVREELGKDFIVMTDANQGYSVDVALKASDAFADCGAYWLEEPLFVEDIEGHAILREKSQDTDCGRRKLAHVLCVREFHHARRGRFHSAGCGARRWYHGDKKNHGASGAAQGSRVVSHLGRRSRPCRQCPFIGGAQRLHRDGARLHLQSIARRIIARAVQSAKRFSDPTRKTRAGH